MLGINPNIYLVILLYKHIQTELKPCCFQESYLKKNHGMMKSNKVKLYNQQTRNYHRKREI